MEVEEARSQKRELEEMIQQKLYLFSLKTGLEVERVNITCVYPFKGESDALYRVDLDVRF